MVNLFIIILFLSNSPPGAKANFDKRNTEQGVETTFGTVSGTYLQSILCFYFTLSYGTDDSAYVSRRDGRRGAAFDKRNIEQGVESTFGAVPGTYLQSIMWFPFALSYGT